MKISRTNAYNIEIPRNIDETKSGMWTFMRFDPCYFIKSKLANNYKDFANLKDITFDTCILKSIELFSTIHVRGIYISNIEFNTDNMSKEMQFRTLNNRPIVPIIFSDICEGQKGEDPSMKPETMKDDKIEDKIIMKSSSKKKAKAEVKKYEIGDLDQNIKEIEQRREIMKKEAEQRKKENIADIMNIKVSKATNKNDEDRDYQQKLMKANAELKEMESGLLNKNMFNVNESQLYNRLYSSELPSYSI